MSELNIKPETLRKLREIYEEGSFVSPEQMMYNLLAPVIKDDDLQKELHEWMKSVYKERIEKPAIEQKRKGHQTHKIGEEHALYSENSLIPRTFAQYLNRFSMMEFESIDELIALAISQYEELLKLEKRVDVEVRGQKYQELTEGYKADLKDKLKQFIIKKHGESGVEGLPL